ncbi:MAG: hypothetical protein ACYDFR_03555 [Candidatus Omnitrophota bacterium]
MLVVPFININLALLTGIYINRPVIMVTALCSLVFIFLLSSRGLKRNNLKKIFSLLYSKDELLVLPLFVSALVFLFFYYSNIEFLLSLAAYLVKGDAPCFYMQSFRTIGLLNPGFSRLDALTKVYEIICTPGNILLTSTFLPVLKINCFKIIYLVFNALLLIFSYLLCRKLVKNRIIALLVSAFSVLNPYVLSVEVLDRNFMSLAISVILFYVLLEYKEKRFLQGLIFGILAGTGLRFLPLVFIVPIFILWGEDNDLKRIALFAVAFFITFFFNIPHLFFNGLNSLGENGSSWQLLFFAFTKWARTPFVPFPNLIFYLVNIINYFGLLIWGIICFGVYCIYKENKKLFFSFLLMFLLVVVVLAYQRNWLEGDKYRIVISGFLPLYIFLVFGLKAIFYRPTYAKKITPILVSFTLPVIFFLVVSGINFNQDAEFYQRKYLYQKESREYYQLSKGSLLKAGIFPNYERLFLKLNLKRKKTDELITLSNLFPESNFPNFKKFVKFYEHWKTAFSKDKKNPLFSSLKNSKDYVYLKINFDKLMKNNHEAVEQLESADMVSLDLSAKEQLSDVFYTQFDVSWQNNFLPVCVILNNNTIDNFKELTIDLNAFVSLGHDDLGCDIINSIDFTLNPPLKQQGFKTGMKSFPLYEENKSLIFKIPADMKIIVKNWFINQENGVPFKVDSWLIKRDRKGSFKVLFFYNEPESYL